MKMGIASRCMSFGKALDIKFEHAERTTLEREEQVLARFFSPSYEKKYRAWELFPVKSREGGDYIAVTNLRLFWITERNQNCPERAESILRYAPLANVVDVSVHHTGRNWGVICRFRGGTCWCVPLPAEQSGDAAAFADEALSVVKSFSFTPTD
jgi:hypothetical protein